jgi:hypothetical protein
MSLINDALKRAREAQQQTPPPPIAEPQLHAVEPEKHTRHNVGFLILLALALITLGGLVLVWQISRKQSDDIQQVAAKTPPATAPAGEPSSTRANPTAIAPADTAPANPTPAVVVTNAAPVPDAPPAPPPPPKLQGIVFNPKRPSALIDGRTVFLGDRFGQFRVVAITPQTVTLAGAGVTNVLSFAE